ncbi:hypothetical protein CEXT_552961 [Caerostris extrusa]|uniref:Uncharacterized protein n=1 Tax=Caerostris extrusa TaxID=172846 RepID=A0AAV4NLR0_CAEEX|nr:hypothetical protein CEXT_552961 [Caerostris extrusa]
MNTGFIQSHSDTLLTGRQRIDKKSAGRTCDQWPPLKSRLPTPGITNPPQEVGSINPSRCAGNHWGSLSSGGEHYKKTTGDPRPTLPRRQRKTSLQVYPPVTDPSSFTPFA